MKKIFWVFTVVIIVAASLLPACGSKEIKEEKTAASSEEIYTCPMHPQIQEHHPGDCPICGMKLVKKSATTATVNNIELESLLKPANEFVVASLPVTTPQQKTVTIPIKFYGT